MKQQFKLWLALAAVGAVGGLVGIVLTEIMHVVQHFAYDYSNAGGYTPFRVGVEAAPPLRRLLALTACGVLAGGGWWLLKRRAAPLVPLKTAVAAPLAGLPFAATIAHALLQIVTVGMGSPLGREVAPREMTAAFASAGVRRFGFDEPSARLLIACASGAGLAAVYNVPLAGALFALEVMLASWSPPAAAAALLTSALAAAVARLGLGDVQQYPLPDLAVGTPLVWWSAAAGPLLGVAAGCFRRSVRPLPFLARGDGRIVALAVAAFALIGAAAMWFPDILGNGKAGNQLVFSELIDWKQSVALFVLKWAAVLLALAAGAYGGLITPSMMLGSTLAFAGAALWNAFLPHTPPASAAVVGAAVFLGVAQRMPLTALVFALELTRAPASLLMPLCLCMAGALAAGQEAERRMG